MNGTGGFYGLTYQGGAYARGVAFELAPNSQNKKWTETILHSFGAGADGWPPNSLILDSSGNLYGTTSGVENSEGDGTVFELTPTAPGGQWTESVLYGFCSKENCADGAFPTGLIPDGSGNFFGTTSGGGANDNDDCTVQWTGFVGCGALFELSPKAPGGQWSESVLYNFCGQTNCADGAEPSGAPIMDGSGNFYGTTFEGGPYDAGTAFELDAQGTENALHTFCSQIQNNGDCTDGQFPEGGLIMDEVGNLYGTTTQGGANCQSQGGCGVVFELVND
jgi:uncharacterized repeat protein (TIGR03803 family)